MLFAGFNVADGEYSLFAVDCRRRRSANLVGSWIAYAVGYYGRVELLEKHGRKLHIKPTHLALGRPLVRALRRRDRLLLAHAADRPHVHLAARGRRADAVLALHACSRSLGCIPWVFALAFIGKQAGDNWDDWKDHLHYVDYAVAALIVARRRLPRRALAARGAAAAPMRRPERRARRATRSRSGCCTGPAELLPISSSATSTLVPWLLGWPYAELRRRAAQGVRGRAARRHGGGAARRAARRGRRGGARPRPRGAARCRWLVRAAGDRRARARAADRAAPRRRPRRSPPGCWSARAAMVVGRPPRRRRAARRDGRRPRRRARARRSPRPARWCPGVSRNGADARRRARCAASTARTPTRCRATSALPVHRRRDRAEGRAAGAARAAAGHARARSRPAPAPSFASTLGSTRLIRRSSATARWRRTPPTARRSRPRWSAASAQHRAR